MITYMSHVQANSELKQIKNNTTDNFFNDSAEKWGLVLWASYFDTPRGSSTTVWGTFLYDMEFTGVSALPYPDLFPLNLVLCVKHIFI
jgi:hypothetical protein